MNEEVKQDYIKTDFACIYNLESIKIEYNRLNFFIEIFLGVIMFIIYLLVCFKYGFKDFYIGVIVFSCFEIFFLVSAFTKKKKKTFFANSLNISNNEINIPWSNVQKIQRIMVSRGGSSRLRFEILRIESSNESIDVNLEELNFKKEELIFKILKFWSASGNINIK